MKRKGIRDKGCEIEVLGLIELGAEKL